MQNTSAPAPAAPITAVGLAVLDLAVFAYGGELRYNTDGTYRVVMSQDMRDQRCIDTVHELYG